MQRLHQILFAVSLLALSWFAMQAVHELGHVVAAVLTGGKVARVVLHPATISRTDVSPNPSPAMVVWLGPVVGALLPLVPAVSTRRSGAVIHKSLAFFAGFCLIANGAYISVGSFEGVGDAGEMLRTGTPLWTMHAFGAAAMLAGLLAWHRLGSPAKFFREPPAFSGKAAYGLLAVTLTVAAMQFALSPR